MSVTIPQGDVIPRVESRIRGNVIGDIIFIAVYLILPENCIAYLGVIGGFGAGFCARYEGQTAWNSFSALTVAVPVIGFYSTVAYRVLNNVFGALFALAFGKIIERFLLALSKIKIKRIKSL